MNAFDDLYNHINDGNWSHVIKVYEQNPETHSAEITGSGDTALHVAVYNGQESTVEALVAVVSASGSISALRKKNMLGNTPLHLAAYLGNARMCRCLAELDPELMGLRNKDKETPLFVAVRHGQKEAFHVLQSLAGPEKVYKYSRAKDGETILHSAIAGEYFDLAYEIISGYPRLLDYMNENDMSALHILASKPLAFRSGIIIRRLHHELIYRCIFVDKLPLKTRETGAADLERKEGAKYPRNFGMFSFLWLVTSGHSRGKNDEESNKKNKQREEAHPRARGMAQEREIRSISFFSFFKLIPKAVLGILGVERMRAMKRKHLWSVQIMEKLLDHARIYKYGNGGKCPNIVEDWTSYTPPYGGGAIDLSQPVIEEYFTREYPPIKDLPCGECGKSLSAALGLVENNARLNELCLDERGGGAEANESPILIAAKNGVLEMVAGILKRFPAAALDVNSEQKNVVLLAIEHRQPHVYEFLTKWQTSMRETMFRKKDKEGNSALHLAARLGKNRPWPIPALQMQWEIKWFKFVRDSMPLHYFFPHHNNLSETPRDIFIKTHGELAKESSAWLAKTSQSCSVVAALIVTVAFPTFATLPGGVKSDNSGIPTLQNQPFFSVFAISSLFAFCFSAVAVVMFLALLTSRIHEVDFEVNLPRRLHIGMTSLFISIESMLLSFCGGHFFVTKERLQDAALPVYAIMFLPIIFFACAQFPFYFDLVLATIRKAPQRIFM